MVSTPSAVLCMHTAVSVGYSYGYNAKDLSMMVSMVSRTVDKLFTIL